MKERIDLIPPSAILGMGEVLAYGKRKYPEDDWRVRLTEDDLYAKAMRHLLKWKENRLDESGLSHLKHAMINIAFLIEKER